MCFAVGVLASIAMCPLALLVLKLTWRGLDDILMGLLGFALASSAFIAGVILALGYIVSSARRNNKS